jgi:hypothetical protein
MNPFTPFPVPTDLRATAFPPTSRYHGLELGKYTLPNGREVAYVTRRFVPKQERFATLREYTVSEGDRLDNIAAQHLGDPEQFWRLADANNELDPYALTSTPGRRIRITLPEGIPGLPPNA